MIKVKTPNYYADAARKEFSIGKDVCSYGNSERLTDRDIYFIKELATDLVQDMRDDYTLENLKKGDWRDAVKITSDKFKLTVKVMEKTLKVLMKIPANLNPHIRILNYLLTGVETSQDMELLYKALANTQFRNKLIDEVCEQERAERNQLFLERFNRIQEEKRINYDKISPPRLKAPVMDNYSDDVMTA